MSTEELARHRELEERYDTLTPAEKVEYEHLSKKFDEYWQQKVEESTAAEKAKQEAERVQGLKDQAHKVAADLGFDKSRIDFVKGTREFDVNGVKHTAAGDADISKGAEGRIRIYTDHTDASWTPGLTAHEIEHEKFQSAIDAYRRESDAIMKDRPAPNPQSEHWWERRGEIMKADGSLFPPYDKKYPHYTAMHDALYSHGLDEFAKGDGVSDYSAEYWKGYHERKVSSDIALHETLAEMARIKYTTGKFPEHYGYSRVISERLKGTATTPEGYTPMPKGSTKGTTMWRNLYRTVDSIWKVSR
jgi:hypothetical protein